MESVDLSIQEKTCKIDFPDGDYLEFLIRTMLTTFDLQVHLILPSSESTEEKIDFQNGRHGGHLGFLIGTILASFEVTPILPIKVRVNCLLVQEKKRKIGFQDGRHGGYLGFFIGTTLVIFDLQVSPIFPTKFRVN